MHAGGDPGFDLAGEDGFVEFGRTAGVGLGASARQGFSTNDEGTRLLSSISLGNTDYSCVENGRMGEEKRFELGRGDLEGGDFDEVLIISAKYCVNWMIFLVQDLFVPPHPSFLLVLLLLN